MRIEQAFTNHGISTVSSANRRSESDTARSGADPAGAVAGDPVTISDAAQVSSILGTAFRFDPGPDGTIRVPDIRASYHRELSLVQDRLANALEEAGVDRSQSFELRVDEQGAIRVVGDHPDRETIEKIFADDPSLANDFRYVDATGGLLRAIERHEEFVARWNEDPVRAVEEFSHLFSPSRRPEGFVLEVNEDDFEADFRGRD